MAESKTTPKPVAPSGGKASANGLNKMQAVTKLIAERGMSIKPVEIREILKKRFGLEISADVASSYKKTLARRQREAKGEAKPATAPAAAKSTPAPAAAKSTPAPAAASAKPAVPPKPKGKFNKLGAVRKAMGKLGMDAGRQDIHDYVKKAYGVEISLDHISTCRANIRSQVKQVAPKAAAPPAPKPATTQKPTPVAVGNEMSSVGISLSDIQAVKALLGRVDATELKGLIDVLSK